MVPPPNVDIDTRDRVIRLEEKVVSLQGEVSEMSENVKTLVAYANQAKGARWALGLFSGAAGFGGGLASGKLTALAAWLFKGS